MSFSAIRVGIELGHLILYVLKSIFSHTEQVAKSRLWGILYIVELGTDVLWTYTDGKMLLIKQHQITWFFFLFQIAYYHNISRKTSYISLAILLVILAGINTFVLLPSIRFEPFSTDRKKTYNSRNKENKNEKEHFLDKEQISSEYVLIIHIDLPKMAKSVVYLARLEEHLLC